MTTADLDFYNTTVRADPALDSTCDGTGIGEAVLDSGIKDMPSFSGALAGYFLDSGVKHSGKCTCWQGLHGSR